MEPPSTHAVSTLNRSGRRLRLAKVREAIRATIDHMDSPARHRSVELVVVGDVEIRKLNLATRGVDEATDVLSFPAPVFPGSPLGEVVISVEFAERQADARGLTLEAELSYLAIHGTLHLLGLDDETAIERERMFREMHAIGAILGLPEQREWYSVLKAPMEPVVSG